MDEPTPQTEFVRRAIEGKRYSPDQAYARDLLQLERLATMRPLGLASAMNLSNLISRYPREADAIVRELGVRPFGAFEEERVGALTAERLRLAERRRPLGRLVTQESLGLFDF